MDLGQLLLDFNVLNEWFERLGIGILHISLFLVILIAAGTSSAWFKFIPIIQLNFNSIEFVCIPSLRAPKASSTIHRRHWRIPKRNLSENAQRRSSPAVKVSLKAPEKEEAEAEEDAEEGRGGNYSMITWNLPPPPAPPPYPLPQNYCIVVVIGF